MLGARAEPSRKKRQEAGGPHFYGASRYAANWERAKGKLLRCGSGSVSSWKAFTSIPVAKTLRHISCLLQGTLCSPLLLRSLPISTQFPFFYIFFCPVSLRWKDQIRSSVKIARQRFACQGISFCYLYWNIIRFTLSPFAHLTLPRSSATSPFPFSSQFPFHWGYARNRQRQRQRQLFDSIRFDSNRFRFDFWRVTKLNLCQLQFYVSC